MASKTNTKAKARAKTASVGKPTGRAKARVVKPPTKAIKTQLRSLRKGLETAKAKSVKGTQVAIKKAGKIAKQTGEIEKQAGRIAQKTGKIEKEMASFQKELDELRKKKTPKKQLSEYNLFMGRQLKDGKSFKAAVKLWKAYIKGKPLIKTRVVTVKSKPKIITKTRTVKVNVPGKTKIVYRDKPVIKTRTVKVNVPGKTKIVYRDKPVIKTVIKTVKVPAKQEFDQNKFIADMKKAVRSTVTEELDTANIDRQKIDSDIRKTIQATISSTKQDAFDKEEILDEVRRAIAENQENQIDKRELMNDLRRTISDSITVEMDARQKAIKEYEERMSGSAHSYSHEKTLAMEKDTSAADAGAKNANYEISTTIREDTLLSKKTREVEQELLDEKVAIDLLTVYYQEVHRLGLKRRMELDDVVNSYFDTLAKIKARKPRE